MRAVSFVHSESLKGVLHRPYVIFIWGREGLPCLQDPFPRLGFVELSCVDRLYTGKQAGELGKNQQYPLSQDLLNMMYVEQKLTNIVSVYPRVRPI